MTTERAICRRRRNRASKETCLTKLASNSISIPTTSATTTTLLVCGLLVGLLLARDSSGSNAADQEDTPSLLSTTSEQPPLAHQDGHLERLHTATSMASRHRQPRPPPPPTTSRGQTVKIGLPTTAGQMINELAGVTLTRPPAADQHHRQRPSQQRQRRQDTRLTRRSSAGQDNNNNNNSEVELDEETISLARESSAASSRLSISNKVNSEDTGEQEDERTTSGGNNNNSELLPPAWLLKCRVEKDLYLDFDEYQRYTCANCYNQVPPEYFKEKLEFVRLDERTVRLLEPEPPSSSSGPSTPPAEIVVWTNDTSRIRQTFKDEEKFDKWRMCCRQAEECCLANSKHLTLGTSRRRRKATGEGLELVDNPQRTECPGTWDGLSCWPASPAGKAWHECPRVAYLLDFEPACRGYVSKQCFPNASWYINRNGHEWSDYSTCSPEGLYKKRMLTAAVAYICEALIVFPALLIIGKFPNRGGNKRIRIMKHLLFYILLNSLIQFLQRGFLAAGYFAEYRSGPMRIEHHARHQPPVPTPPAPHQQQPPNPLNPSTSAPAAAAAVHSLPDKLALISSATTVSSSGHQGARHARSIELRRPTVALALTMADHDDLDEDELVARIFLTGGQRAAHHRRDRRRLREAPVDGDDLPDSGRDDALALATKSATKPSNGQFIDPRAPRGVNEGPLSPSGRPGRARLTVTSSSSSSGKQARLRMRRAENSTRPAQPARVAKREGSVWKAFSCWFLQMTSRLVRLMSYAWMFTGGVYLCSALHCAPAEPPAKFIKVLFFLTNAFPTMIFLAYVTARTLNEPSPLNIIIKVPYYWLRGDRSGQTDHLYATQQVCWFEESKSQSIEDIADLPNMILVGLNVLLFVFTLIILCRINRPGSTRPDMSPCAYFKAAGTLLFLYGGHYFFLAYRPESESCGMDTFIFYAFIAIDVVQGIAISIVFCYMTQEGKAVISKYWRNRNRFTPFRQCAWLSCTGDKNKLANNGYHHTSHNGNHNYNNQYHHRHHQGKLNRQLNHSTRSNTSACNGHDNVTELVNLNDTQIGAAGQF